MAIFGSQKFIKNFWEKLEYIQLKNGLTKVEALYRPGQPNVEKVYQDFSATQILRGINFGDFVSEKSAILTK